MIISITKACNLRCKGCYATAVGTVAKSPFDATAGCGSQTIGHPTLNAFQWENIIQQAIGLGIFGFIIAGGEPFLYSGLLDLCAKFNNAMFVIFTNGTVLTDENILRIKKIPNIVVVVSIEGDQTITDARRGVGTYNLANKNLEKLLKSGILTGISVTVTRLNYQYWTTPANVDVLVQKGVRLGFFMEYIPSIPTPTSSHGGSFSESTGDLLMLTSDERRDFRAFILDTRNNKPIYLVHSPGDEDLMGGCISAGRGFAHITPWGDLTACPVSNIATHNLTTASLADALASPLFQKIRDSEHLLETGNTPCALFAHPEEMKKLAEEVGAYRTDQVQNQLITPKQVLTSKTEN